MKKVIFTLAIVAMVFSIMSCSSPLDKKYNEQTLDTDIKEIGESKKLNEAELLGLSMYIVRAKMIGESLENKTYKEIFTSVKELQAKQEKEAAEAKALAEKVAKEKEEKRALFSKTLTVSMYDKGYLRADWQSYLVYDVAFENKSDKDIRAVKGSLLITDLFDSPIKEISLVQDKGVKAGGIYKASYNTEYNQFIEEDVLFKSKDIKDLKVIWNPEKIIFSDGSTLE